MATIRPTQNFVLLRFVPKNGGVALVLPDGHRNPDDEIQVVAVGPDVPKEPELKEGSKVLLRGDAKIFAVDEKQQESLVVHQMIMAVVEDELILPTDEEINRVATQG